MQEERRPETRAQDDTLLVRRAISRDPEAFGRLYDMYVDRVYRHVYYRVGNVADAEDLTQQVFLKAWQAIDRYKKTASPFLAWLMTISHNLVVDFYRTSNRENRRSRFCHRDADKRPEEWREETA